jgi:hypothetical protein
MHRNHPQGMKDSPWKYCVFRNTYNSTQTAAAPIAYAITTRSILDKLFTAPLNPRHPTVGASPAARMQSIQADEQQFPVRQVG